MSDNQTVFEQYGKWNILNFRKINHTIEKQLLPFCYNFEVEIKSTDKQFKQLYIYFTLKEILKWYKKELLLPNKALLFDPLDASYIIDSHWNETEYNLFIKKIANMLSNGLPIYIGIYPDNILDDRLDLYIKKNKTNNKKINSFIKKNNLGKIEDNIYSIILSN